MGTFLLCAIVLNVILFIVAFSSLDRKGYSTGMCFLIASIALETSFIGFLIIMNLPYVEEQKTYHTFIYKAPETNNNTWRCNCGRVNSTFVGTCGCGTSRR